VYLDTDPPTVSNFILGNFNGISSGYGIAAITGKKAFYYQYMTGINGAWSSPLNSITLSSWVHVLVTYDSTNPTTNEPKFYINGVLQALTVVQSPTGTVEEETGTNFVVGNTNSSLFPYTLPFDGKIFDARVYNRILTAAEVTTLYNAGVPDTSLVTDGLVFQGPAVYADKGTAANLAGTVLTSSDRLIENIIRAVGIPNGSPTIRANP
ncbi:MAG: LamG domain-containing protein, partial [Alphaproteobacteria bacterium]|nr:LamG domain-containing protein [Alphaproteobacteria bacterium]